MTERIFLAGATGAIGRRLIPLLLQAGHQVWGTTRAPSKAEKLSKQGVEPVLLDVFDADALRAAILKARPTVVIHQLTDLPAGLDPALMAEAVTRNASIREIGTKNLVAATLASGARRLIAQSIAWAYATGPLPHTESEPLDTEASGARGISVSGVASLERQVLAHSAAFTGIVLRYGQLYGPGTGTETQGSMPVHVDAAAYAACLAVDHGVAGPYNIAEPNPQVTTHKAAQELGWRADYRLASN